MTRVPQPGGGSGDFIINPQDLSDTAPEFTKSSKEIFEQELILDSQVESVIKELELLQSLAEFAEALRTFKERASEIMHCMGHGEAVVGQALEETAFAFYLNEGLLSDLFNNPGFQPIPELPKLLGIFQPTAPEEPIPLGGFRLRFPWENPNSYSWCINQLFKNHFLVVRLQLLCMFSRGDKLLWMIQTHWN